MDDNLTSIENVAYVTNKYCSTFLQTNLCRLCRSIWVMLTTRLICRIGWLIVNMRGLVIMYKWNRVKWKIDSRWMIYKTLDGWSIWVSKDDQPKFRRMIRFKRAVDSDLTVICVGCMQMECGILIQVLENKEAFRFPCLTEDIQRCWKEKCRSM